MTSVRNGLDPRQQQIEAAIQEALAAVERAHLLLRAPGDPLVAAVDSAVTCAVSLMVLRRSGPTPDIDALRDALGTARALVGELTFAIRDRYPTTATHPRTGDPTPPG